MATSRGEFPLGKRTTFMVGFNENPTIDVEETIWDYGGRYVWPDFNGEFMEITSASAGDAGKLIYIDGLDGNGFSVTDFVVCNGTTPVQTNIAFSRVNRLLNFSATPLAGEVLLRGLGSGPIYSGMKVGNDQSEQLVWSVPTDKRAELLPAEATVNKDGGSASSSALFSTIVTRPGVTPWRAGRWGLQTRGGSTFLFETADRPLLVPREDVEITVRASHSDMDVSGRVGFRLWDA
jgi:hypothetical protein